MLRSGEAARGKKPRGLSLGRMGRDRIAQSTVQLGISKPNAIMN
jgi:hypothetical protein